MIALGKCKVISLNVRGLRTRIKRRSIFCLFKDQNCDVFFDKRRTLRTTKMCAKVNGEVACSFHMDQYTVEVFASC